MGTSSPEAAFVFLFDGAQWVGQAKLSGSDTEAGDQFGASVSISGSMAFVGAYGDDDAGSSSGSVYVFRGLSDCNRTAQLDVCELLDGAAEDLNDDGLPDECVVDCNLNGVLDGDDIAGGTSQDCNGDGVPDECGDDCNVNGLADSCDIASGTSQDCNADGLPDECGPDDCNLNGFADSCDIAGGASQDCNDNSIPDECEAGDCNGNGIPDSCDIAAGTSQDCNGNGIPDECEAADCNGNGVHDQCDVGSGTSTDFDGNGIPDECQIPPPNNVCGNAGPIAEGVFPFSTIGAQTDGLPTGCSGGPGLSFERDIWFLYTPSCFGTATFSVCNAANFDTRLAVYTLAPCPPLSVPLACSDNAPGCGDTSHVELLVHPAIQYLVRVGGTTSTSGLGTLTVTCRP
jgi:hypothetical protein